MKVNLWNDLIVIYFMRVRGFILNTFPVYIFDLVLLFDTEWYQNSIRYIIIGIIRLRCIEILCMLLRNVCALIWKLNCVYLKSFVLRNLFVVSK